MIDVEDLQYPIGKPAVHEGATPEQHRRWIDEIAAAPVCLREAVKGLSEEQLDTPYRPGGWTVRQVVHHLVDSHLNSYIRFKLALTEEEPTIKAYDEKRWAELLEGRTGPVEMSLDLLEALHRRWVAMLRALSAQDLARRFRHPERGEVSLEWNLGIYAWHGRHHVAHITSLRRRMGW